MNKLLIFSSFLLLQIHVLGQTDMNMDWYLDTTICETDTLVIPLTSDEDYSNYKHVWYLNGTELSDETSITVDTSGIYRLELIDTDTLYGEFVVIIDKENPDFMITPVDLDITIDSLVCLEDNITLTTDKKGAEYLWYVDNTPLSLEIDTLDSLNIYDISEQINFNQEYEYSVRLTNSCGSYLSSNSISMIVNECECALDMPNVFSPNKDEINKVFKPFNNSEFAKPEEELCKSTDFKMEIFSQWGRHIASIATVNEYPSWDGKNKNGKEVTEGVYFYHVIYQVNIFTQPKMMETSGAFHLFR